MSPQRPSSQLTIVFNSQLKQQLRLQQDERENPEIVVCQCMVCCNREKGNLRQTVAMEIYSLTVGCLLRIELNQNFTSSSAKAKRTRLRTPKTHTLFLTLLPLMCRKPLQTQAVAALVYLEMLLLHLLGQLAVSAASVVLAAVTVEVEVYLPLDNCLNLWHPINHCYTGHGPLLMLAAMLPVRGLAYP